VNAPDTTLVFPAGSISPHHGPVAPNLFLNCAFIDLTLSPFRLSILENNPPLANELLHFSTPNAYNLAVAQLSPFAFPGKHLLLLKFYTHISDDAHF
jgi:hypothetical protein